MAMGNTSDGGRDSIDRAGSYAIQAGLLSTALVGITVATFGPYFYPALGNLLLAAAGIAAIVAFCWADRVVHAAPPNTRVARREARFGRILAFAALSMVVWYTGLWILLAFLWPVVTIFGLLAWTAHRMAVASSVSAREAGN